MVAPAIGEKGGALLFIKLIKELEFSCAIIQLLQIKQELIMQTDNIMSLEAMAEALKEIRLYDVVDKTGVTYPTLGKLRDQTSTNFTLNVLRKVSDYLREELKNEQARFDDRQNRLKKVGAL